jgi:hypothetical protein
LSWLKASRGCQLHPLYHLSARILAELSNMRVRCMRDDNMVDLSDFVIALSTQNALQIDYVNWPKS